MNLDKEIEKTKLLRYNDVNNDLFMKILISTLIVFLVFMIALILFRSFYADKMMDNSGSPQASQNSNTDKMMDNSGSPQASQNSNTDVQIKFFKKGQITIISPSSPIFSLLKRECENLLVSSNNAIYELVIDEIIKNIKDNNIAIELIYNKIKEMKINNPAYKENKIAIDRILIPLSGYYGNGTIFYGYKHYSSGPFVNSMGTQKIKDILISAGIDTN